MISDKKRTLFPFTLNRVRQKAAGFNRLCDIRKNWIFYSLGLVIVFGLKYFFSSAGSNELDWILAPTVLWVRTLSGIQFSKVPDAGYINHDFRFIIAASCSGLQFITITFATLFFAFVNRVRSNTGKFCWLGLNLVSSYLFTVFINGLRIALSICLYKTNTGGGWLTPERLHTITGAAIYFSSLLAIWHLTDSVFPKDRGASEGRASGRRLLTPVFWYFLIMLIIPFINRVCRNNGENFIEFAATVTAVCLLIVLLHDLSALPDKRFTRKIF